MRVWLPVWLGCLLFAAGAIGKAAGQTLSFSLDRAGSPPAQYAVRVDEHTGQGTFRDTSSPAVSGAASDGKAAEVPITVSPELLKKLFAAVPDVRSGHCETHSKKIAQTGAKTLRYEGEGAPAECTYNYSDDERVNTATSLFEAIGETMQFGDRLASRLRFDRLGLDLEMDNLQSAITDGRAVEVGNIAPVLRAIQNDERVMERVRRKAAHTLERAGVSAGVPGPA